ncbi:MetQ/NlpA family ABC transporter substrate-binding protein [Bifidobacterium aquikefiri]|uniref:Lipoprotein n=1 Tax=Bifidobacterium aquikefiri TaxID=1653207 RepID=A0A261GC70_9BIFI|nr:MetQ/NlpA family ABC transporter substrate-binding protein [Bifidobacterium aquikefiri]OZG68755.1 ABC superfamily ATP binding cassette transporter, binding protein [Bifidobacterium aquikefiri]
MKSIKTRLIILAAILATVAVVAVAVFAYNRFRSDESSQITTVKVGVDSDSYNDIWDAVNAELTKNKSGIQVELVHMDGSQINAATANGELDLNAFQHHAFLDDQNESEGYDLTTYANTFIQPMNVYSDSIESLDDLKDGDSVVLPNNPTNMGRALKVLERAGVLKTNPDKGYLPTEEDVTDNPKHLVFNPVEYPQVPRLLPDNAVGIINTNVAIDAGLDPIEDSIYSVPVNPDDEYNLPWINIIAGRATDAKNPAYVKVVEAYGTESVKKVIEEKHAGQCIYVFSDEVNPNQPAQD